MDLQWKANVNLSALHAAWCIVHFREIASRPAESLKVAALALGKLASDARLDQHRFWEQLLTLAATHGYSAELAKRVSSRLGISAELFQSRLAAAVNECRKQFEAAHPRYATEILLRGGPLQQLWAAQGPGLLRMIAGLTEDCVIVENAEIVLVQPIAAGMGFAHLSTNRVHIEALLTNVSHELPETLRLAWLLAQLDLERPVYSELINGHRLRTVAGLAMLAPVLLSGQELELCHYSTEQIEKAISLWRLASFQHGPLETSQIVASWWETYQAARPEWRIALTGLDKMLG